MPCLPTVRGAGGCKLRQQDVTSNRNLFIINHVFIRTIFKTDNI